MAFNATATQVWSTPLSTTTAAASPAPSATDSAHSWFLLRDDATDLTMIGFVILALLGLLLTCAKSDLVKYLRARRITKDAAAEEEQCHRRWIDAEMGRATHGRHTSRRLSCSSWGSDSGWAFTKPLMLGAIVVSEPMEVHLWMGK